MPLVNIILSNKMEANLKTSALSQITFLIKSYKKIFCEDLFFFFKNEFLRLFLKYNNKFSGEALNNLDFEYYQKFGNDIISYISNLLRVFNLIIYFYHDHNNIQDFITIKENFLNSELFIFISGIIPLLFSKHTLATQSMMFLSLLTFTQYNMNPFIINSLDINEENYKLFIPNILLKYHTIPFSPMGTYPFKNS